MLYVTSKNENETFLITRICEFTETAIESSRNLTSKVISNRIRARKSKFTEQYDCFSFASTAHVIQWLNYLTQRAEILRRQSNLTPQRAKNTVNDLSVVPKSLST